MFGFWRQTGRAVLLGILVGLPLCCSLALSCSIQFHAYQEAIATLD